MTTATITPYAKEENNELVRPAQSEFPGVPHFEQHDALLRSHGYMPMVFEEEEREGYNRIPVAWHKVEQSETRTEPRAVTVDDYEIDEETGERRKTGSHQEWQDTEIVFDASYFDITECRFDPIPVPPPPEPEPVVYSKLKIVKAMLTAGIWGDFWAALTPAQQVLWENAVNFNSQYPEFSAGLAAFKQAFPSIDADAMLEQCIAE